MPKSRRSGGRGANRRIMAKAYTFLQENGVSSSSEIHEYLINENGKNLPSKMCIGLILSHSTLFEKAGETVGVSLIGSSGRVALWRARTLEEVVARAISANSTGKALPVFFRRAIQKRREEINAENSMAERNL